MADTITAALDGRQVTAHFAFVAMEMDEAGEWSTVDVWEVDERGHALYRLDGSTLRPMEGVWEATDIPRVA